MSRKPLSKAEKSLFLVCALALVPLAAIVFVSSGRDAEPNWNIPPAAPRPKPNGYGFYVAAAKATFRFTPEVDPASDAHQQPPGSAYALKNYSLARRNQWLAANAKTFALLNQGLHTPSMAPDYTGVMNRDWSRLRQLGRDISARSRTFQLAKQPMRATMSSLDGMQMAQDTTRGGGLLARLVGVALMAIGRSPLDDFDKTINSLSAEEARRAARRLEAILAREPVLSQTLTQEKRIDLLELHRMLSAKNWRGSMLPNKLIGETASQAWQRQTISKRAILDNALRVEDASIANSKLPYSQTQKAVVPTQLDPFTQYFGTSSNRSAQNEARNATSNNMLLLRLALRAYIAQHKTAPPTLSALVPDILKKVPTDIYNDGKPLFYQPKGATYRLWSVGPDMINNGGTPFPPRSPGAAKFPVSNTLENKGDFVAGLCR
jgi:hypothetical protein